MENQCSPVYKPRLLPGSFFSFPFAWVEVLDTDKLLLGMICANSTLPPVNSFFFNLVQRLTKAVVVPGSLPLATPVINTIPRVLQTEGFKNVVGENLNFSGPRSLKCFEWLIFPGWH